MAEYTPVSGEVTAQGINDPLSAINSDLVAHKAESVSDAGGVHGFEVESGLWTPTIKGLTVEGVHNYDEQRGYYQRQGDLVKADFYVDLSLKDTTMSGNVALGGLPFAFNSQGFRNPAGSFSFYANVTTGGKTLGFYGVVSNNHCNLSLSGDGVTFALLDAAAITDSTIINGSIFYKI